MGTILAESTIYTCVGALNDAKYISPCNSVPPIAQSGYCTVIES